MSLKCENTIVDKLTFVIFFQCQFVKDFDIYDMRNEESKIYIQMTNGKLTWHDMKLTRHEIDINILQNWHENDTKE